MISEFETYLLSISTSMKEAGVEMKIKKQEISSEHFKLSVGLESQIYVADFTIWERPSIVQVDITTLHLATQKTDFTHLANPRQITEITEAFEKLLEILKSKYSH